jgi:hypothetical protein
VNVWIAIGVTALGCYAVKLLGLLVPAGALERPLVRRLAALLPVALDAWVAGLAAAALALVLRAPFLLVVAAAVGVTAGVRAIG